MKVVNLNKDLVLAERAELASSLWRRTVGLLGRERLDEGDGLILRPCNSVHTCFMRFPIDVIFLDKQGRAVKLVSRLAPFRFSPVVFRSSAVVELPAGTIDRSGLELGASITIVDN